MELTGKRLSDSLIIFAKDIIAEALEEIVEMSSKQLDMPKKEFLGYIRRYLQGLQVNSANGKEAVKIFREKIISYSKTYSSLSKKIIEAVARECLNGK